MIRILLTTFLATFIVTSAAAVTPAAPVQTCPPNSTLHETAGKRFCKCNDGYVLGGSAGCIPEPAPIFTANWNASPQYQSQKLVVQRLLTRIRKEPFRSWILSHVKFERGLSGGDSLPRPEASAKPGTLTFNDGFFGSGPAQEEHQLGLLLFEAGKVLSLAVEAGPAEPRARLAQFVDTHKDLLLALKHAPINGESLSSIVDPDLHSLVGYAFRATALDLDLPPVPPPNYPDEEWQQLREQWPKVRGQLQTELGRLLK